MELELRRARERASGRPVAANLLIPFTTRAHVEVCRKAGTEVVALHAGLDRDLIAQLRQGGAFVLATVGTPEEARGATDAGADGLIVQGREAGGHLVGVEPALRALERVRAVAPGSTPLLLAGGIATAHDVAVALRAGATAVVAGTRFLLTEECSAHPAYKDRVLRAERTLETQLFGLGWPMRHRVVPNAATDRWCRSGALGPKALLAAQRLTTPLARLPMALVGRTVAVQRVGIPLFGPSAPLSQTPDHLVEATALYAGESALRIDDIVPAAEAVRTLAAPAAPTGDAAQSPTITPS
jgi:NAD(P)H-dependent flavin oxidoreductase YrpB (nitropropane dioxygenase family)